MLPSPTPFVGLGMNQGHKMQLVAIGGIQGRAQIRVPLLSITWPRDQKYPSPLKTTASAPPVVSEGGKMAKKSRIAPHHFLGFWPQTPVRRTLQGWARPPIWSSGIF